MKMYQVSAFQFAAGLLWVSMLNLQAADATWTSATNGNWATGGNWSAAVPTTANTATFNSSGVTVTVDTNRQFRNLIFDTSAGSFTFTGGPFKTDSGATIQMASTMTGTGITQTFSTQLRIQGSSGLAITNNSADSSNIFSIGSVSADFNGGLTLGGVNTGANTVTGAITPGTAAVSFSKTGVGTWSLAGTNTYLGTTTISGGRLNLSGFAASSASSAFTMANGTTLGIDSTSGTYAASVTRAASLSMSGASLLVTGTSVGATNDVITGALTMGINTYNKITISPDSTTAARLSAASLTRNAGSIGFFNGTNLGLDDTSTANVGRVIFTTAPAFVGSTTDGGSSAGTTKSLGIVPYLVGEFGTTGGTATGTANTFLTYNAGTGLRPLDLTNEYTNNAITTGDNTRLNTGTTTAASTDNINSLLISGGDLAIGVSGTVAGSVRTLTVNSGAVLITSSSNISSVGSGAGLSILSLAPTAGTEGIIMMNGGGLNGTISSAVSLGNGSGSARALTLMVGSGSTLRLTGGVSENTTTGSSANFTINGGGTVSLEGSSVYQTNFNGFAYNMAVTGSSVLSYLGSGGLGTAIFNVTAGSTADFNGNTGNTINLTSLTGGGGNLKLTSNSISMGSGTPYTFTGNISGGKALTLANASATNAQTLSGNNTYAGGTTVTASTAASNLRLSGSNALSDTGLVTLNASATRTATIDLNGSSETIGALSGTSAGNNIIGNGSTSSNSTLTINNSLPGSSSFNGVIQNVVGSGTRTVALVKKGSNSQILSGLNTYTGGSTVQNGTLLLDLATNTTGVLASTGTLTLGGGTLTVKGAAAGASSQTLGNLILSANGGASGLVVDQNGGSGTTLTLGNTWTRGSSATLNIDLSSAADAVLTSNPTSELVNDVIAYATVKDATGTGFATVSGGNVVRYTGASALASTSNASTSNFSTSGVLALDNNNRDLNSLSIDTTGGGSLDLGGSSNVVTLASGGLLASGSGNYIISNGQLGASNAELIVHQMGTGTLSLDSTLSGGTGKVVIDGSGTVDITSANSYSGGTWFNGATTQFSDLNNLGSGALTFNGGTLRYASGTTADISSRTVTLVGSGGTIDTNGNNVTLAGNIAAGTGGLTKTGTGTLTLSGLNAYTGDTTVNQGTLILDLSTNSTGVVNAGSALLLSGGTLNVKGKSTGASSQTLGGLAVKSGASSVVLSNNGGSGTTLTINNSWVRTAGATVNFDLSSSSANVLQARDVSNANGIIGGWATITDSTGTGFATYANVAANVTNPIVRNTALATLGTGATTSTSNYSTSGNILQTGSRTINSLSIDTASGAGGLDMGSAARILTVSSGGVLMTGANDYTMSNGQFGAGNAELIVNQYGTGKLIVSGTVSSGTGSLTKTGTGIMELTGTSVYSGATRINNGTLLVSGTGTINNTSGVTVNTGGTFKYNSSTTYSGGAINNAGGSVSGSGNLGSTVLGGSGSVDPGNSPGIITAGSTDPTGGLAYNFEYTVANVTPTWSNATASGNDVLRLTSGVTPFTAPLDSSNVVSLYLGVSSIADGDVFTGGFFTDLSSNFLSSIANATGVFYVLGDGNGTNIYNGTGYYTLAEYDNNLDFNLATVQVGSADFAGGTVNNGYVMELTAVAVPEPSTYAMLGLGLSALWFLRRSGKSV